MDDTKTALQDAGANDSGKEQEQLIAALEAQAEPSQRRFLRHYYEMSSLDSLRLRTPAQLRAIAAAQREWAALRHPGDTLVRVLPPAADSAPDAMAVIETCAADMPFLVDTVAIAIRDTGVAIDWTAHPIFGVRRDADGRLQDIGASAEGEAESWIHIEFEPLADDAGYAALEQSLRDALRDLRCAVADFTAMRGRALALADKLQQVPPGADEGEFAEGRAFLQWLAADHFTFLGYTETRAGTGADGRTQLTPVADNALGLSRPGERYADTDSLIAPREQLDKYADSPRLVVITKANRRSHLHLADTLDVIAVKQYRDDGSLAGTCRFVGLYASDVYAERPSTIPLIRRKAEYVMRRSRLREDAHSGKLLREILYSLPRDELFQSSEDELFRTCMGIRALRDRHHLKLFLRRDRYGRFYSCMIYLPRDRYSRELRDRLAQELMRVFDSQSIDRSVEFLRGPMARVHYIVRTPPGTTIALSADDIEQKLIAATRSWRDQLRDVLMRDRDAGAMQTLARFADAFPLSYTEQATPGEAATDLQYLLRLSDAQPLLPRLMLDTADGRARAVGLKLYAQNAPVALSDILPTLENFGLRVTRQELTEITPRSGPALWIQDFAVEAPASNLVPETQQQYFETALLKTWRGEAENDRINQLVLGAGLNWRQIVCLRALAKYINQIGLPYGRADIEQLIGSHPTIAALLLRIFEARFDPSQPAERRQADEIRYAQELGDELDKVASLDADRVLRSFVAVVHASLRTNFYQAATDGSPKFYISIKLDPSKIPELPMPRPMFEIWVYSPEVEGIHLRGGKVARGGLRWSDRREDFRTEVLGLMKAQMVKNAVIVPVGAKGGFVVKKPVDAANRDAWMAQGIECYKTFLRGLLDITDNRVGDGIERPVNVVCLDAEDPYLVVAADKGTASFSDIANGVSAEYGFWLGDAFASGGSAGYDHKKMGITARGAWESVKRHFREIGVNIQQQPFTVVGIGDMSGDVFGNGMLLSPHIRLLAAFDHRHIFIDPDPDAAKALAERQRLFNLPRSSWADYDASLLSAGGGVFARTAKLIKLSAEAQKALGLERSSYSPPELINAILKAPVDLLWNGGIGTYVKAHHQSHVEVRDRANDAIRVDGRELRCKVVGEGGNLGFTQSGRIEYALQGGRINTDAIDNAAGVHTSDREVNIKIPLNRLMLEGSLTRDARDPLLSSMTADIARFVLRDNYVQSACISLIERESAPRLDDHVGLMRVLERDGLLNRAIEFLPDEETLKERRSEGRGLTRPELAVLVAYSKISLNEAALASDLPDDAFFERELLAYFPPLLVERYRDDLLGHRLRREIIATIIANGIVNRMGVAFAHRMADDSGASRAEVLEAFVVACEVFKAERWWQAIESLDDRVPAELQYRLMARVAGLLRHVTGWMIGGEGSVSERVARYAGPVAQIESLLPQGLPPSYREEGERLVEGLVKESVPETVAWPVAKTLVLGAAPDIADLARDAGVPLADAAAVYFQLGERFRMPWLHAAIVGLKAVGQWQTLARNRLRDDLYRLHRRLAAQVLAETGGDPQARLDGWAGVHERRVKFVQARLAELQALSHLDFQTLSVAVRDLDAI